MVDVNKIDLTTPIRVLDSVKESIPELLGTLPVNRIFRVLWCSISKYHIRDQYFYQSVLRAATLLINEQKRFGIIRFQEFMRVVWKTGLSCYFTRHDGKMYGSSWPDNKQWQKVWEHLRHNKDMKIEWITDEGKIIT